MKRLLYLYPVLVSIFLVVTLFSSGGMSFYPLSSLVLSLLITVAVTTLILYILRLLLRNWGRASFVTLLTVLVVLLYGQLPNEELAGYYLVGGGFLAILGSLFAMPMATPKGLTRLTTIFGVVSMCLVVVAAANLGLTEIKIRGEFHTRESRPLPQLTTSSMPDVYFIYTDEYTSRYVLSRYFGYDNSPFLAELESRGFIVIGNGYSNYCSTLHSLAATLNMEYNDYSRLDDFRSQHISILDHDVGKIFKNLGYKYVHIGNWGRSLVENRNADYNYTYMNDDCRFSRKLIATISRYPPIRSWFGDSVGYGYLRKYIINQFDCLLEIPSMEEKTFAFVCLVPPHAPYLFDADGGEMPGDLSDEEKYLCQVEYVNGRLLEFLDIALDRDNPPIIILQGDHGYRGGMEGISDYDLDLVQRKFGILDAMYLPGLDITEAELPETPVNNFRFLFNAYYGGNYEILEEKCYYPRRGFSTPVDITEYWEEGRKNRGEEY